MEFVNKHRGLVIGGAILIVFLIVGISFFSKYNGLRNTAISKETALVSQYQDNQNELSNYIVQFKESMGVADIGSERLEAILVEAVKGRYDGEMQPGTGGTMFSAISEAYPDLTATAESYAKVQDLVVSGREAYKNKQSKLLDMIRDYDSWRKTDVFNSWMITTFGLAPSDTLTITIGSGKLEKQEALDKIRQIVLVQESIDSYDTGIIEPLVDSDTDSE